MFVTIARQLRKLWSDYQFKLAVFGNYNVGKTALVQRFKDESFDENADVSVGANYWVKTIQLDSKQVKLLIWDTAILGIHNNLARLYCRGTQGILIVYDVTNQESFEDVSMWLEQINKEFNNSLRMLVGNKCDLSTERVVEYGTAKSFADELGLTLIETSAKDGTNVEQTFVRLAAEVKRKVDLSPDSSDTVKRVETNDRTTEQSRCVCS